MNEYNEENIKESIRQSYCVGVRDGFAGLDNTNRANQQVERLYNETITLAKNPIERDYIVIEVDAQKERDIGQYLQKSVGAWMKRGFIPFGSVFTTDNMVFQPMVKKL
jgi:hypothetical protein